ncbi:MAG: hypothetical protein ACKVZ6_06070, partial [Kineosporiaceae bacterium]
GLNFQPTFTPDLPLHEDGIRRPRQAILLVRGPVNQVEVVYDTTLDRERPWPQPRMPRVA